MNTNFNNVKRQVWVQVEYQIRCKLWDIEWKQTRGRVSGQVWKHARRQLSDQIQDQIWLQLGGIHEN